MRLKRFSIQNYRSIRSTPRIDVGNNLTIVGPNNEGKSNVIRALVRARGLTRAEWVARAAKRMEGAEAEVLAARIRLRKLEAKLAEARAVHLKALHGPAKSS